MKTRYLFFLFAFAFVFVCLNAEAKSDTILVPPCDTLMVICTDTEMIKDSVLFQPSYIGMDSDKDSCFNSQSDELSAFTLATNTVNNGFTVVTIICTLLTLLVAVVALFNYREIKEDVKKHEEEIKNKIEELNHKADELDTKNKTIEQVQTLNNQYLQKINQWMYANAYAIANIPGGDIEYNRELMKTSELDFYMMKLFLTKDKHEIDGCINYIKTKGTLEDIEHLQYIVDNDQDMYKQNKASEAIGYIRARFSTISDKKM